MDPQCRAFQDAIDVLGRPWTALVLSVLQPAPLRFSELEEHARGVGAKTLSARLKELEERGLVERSVHPGPPVRVTYALTNSGRAFRKVAEALEQWGRTLPARPRNRPSKDLRALGRAPPPRHKRHQQAGAKR